METIRAVFDETTDARTILLRPGRGFGFALHVCRYSVLPLGGLVDNERYTVALSERTQDLVEDTTTVPADELGGSPGIFFPWTVFQQVPTDVGHHTIDLETTLTFPVPYTVSQLAALWSETLTTALFMSVEVWYDVIELSRLELARMNIKRGGRASTPIQ